MKEEDVKQYGSCLLKGNNHATAYHPKNNEEGDGEWCNADEDSIVKNNSLVSRNVVKHRAQSGEGQDWI